MSMSDFQCLLCDQKSKYTPVHPTVKGDASGDLSAVQCISCRHIQLYPLKYDLDYYEEDEQVNAVIRNYGTPMNVLVEHSWIEARRRVARFGERGVSLAPERGPLRILDIGGGYGFFASEMMRSHPHVTVQVVEPSAARAQRGAALIRERGPDVPVPEFIVEIIDDAFISRHAESYDIITMWHVLEHVMKPVEFFRDVTALAKRNGGLICIEVPNADDELAKLSSGFRDRFFMLEHLSYFTPGALENVVHRAGVSADVRIFGYQRYGIFNYINWIHTNAPQGANPDLFEGEDRWWLEAGWRATREAALNSDALFMIASRHS